LISSRDQAAIISLKLSCSFLGLLEEPIRIDACKGADYFSRLAPFLGDAQAERYSLLPLLAATGA